MSADGGNAPIIIKRKKVISGGGHHGGAWKVAYADFVTAMMAFFMLMWLLNATTEKQRKGIADYFNPTIPINRISGGGEGAFGGESVFSEDSLAHNGTGASNSSPTEEHQARGASGVDTSETPEMVLEIAAVQKMFEGNSGESAVADELLQHIRTRVTDEGLIVEVFDLPNAPLFIGDTTTPDLILVPLFNMLAETFALVVNDIAINGYTRAFPIVVQESPVWDLSVGRAQVARTLLEDAGIDAGRFKRVVGAADRKPVLTDPMAARNNRLELILLRSDIPSRYAQ